MFNVAFSVVALFLGAFLSFLVTNDIRTKQINKLRQELQECKSAYSSTRIIAEECQTEISKLKVDYQRRIREFHKAIQQRSKYSALVDVKAKEEQDECQALRELLDTYRTIELSK